MFGTVLTDSASALAFLAVCGILYWLISRHEPHWSSKDGRRMIARVQSLGTLDQPVGRWREVRVFVDGDHLVVSARGPRSWKLRGRYRLLGKSPDPPPRREIYILQGEIRILLRLPATSRAVLAVDALLG